MYCYVEHIKQLYNTLLCSSSFASDIVAASLQCGIEGCRTSTYILPQSNVTIIFEHSSKVKVIDDIITILRVET